MPRVIAHHDLAAIVNHLGRGRAEPTEDQPMFRIIMDPSNLTTIAAAHEITLALLHAPTGHNVIEDADGKRDVTE